MMEDDLLVPPSSPSLCAARRLSSASVSSNRKRCLQLDFTKIKHCGRQQEMDQLVEALERSLQRSTATTIQNKNTKTNNNNNINQGKSSSYTITVIVEAESGVGKSSLLQRFVETRVQPHPSRPLVGWGKFEERTAATKPFAAIADLMEGIVEEMLQRQEGHIWLTRIVQAVGAEIFSLLEIIPGLARLGNAKKELEKWKEQQQHQQQEEKDPNNQMPHHHQQFQQQQQEQVTDKSVSRIWSSSSSSKVSASVTTTAASVNFEAFGDMARIEWRFERFRIAFRELLACISQHHPLVTILDDLQFAEKDSLALIQAVMENPTPNLQLLILCATRPTNDLNLSLRNFYDRQTSGGPQGMFIHLRGLSQPELCTLIQTLLDRPQVTPDIQALASVILDKTQGNAFVVTHFLRQLEVDGLLTCIDDGGGGGGGKKNDSSGLSQQWTFDCLQIIAHLDGSVSESVEKVIVKNLQLLDDFQRSLLITAASFSTSQFELVVVLLAMQALQHDNAGSSSRNSNNTHDDEQECKRSKEDCRNRTSEEEFPSGPSLSSLPFGMLQDQLVQGRFVLETSIQNGLLEEVAPGKFKFSHDRIREAAYSLLPQGVARSRLHLKIGRQLRKWMNSKEDELEEQYRITLTDESIVMHAAKHSSLGSELVVDSSERSEIAQLNLAAAELSAKKAAFFPAMEYLRDGIDVLQPNAWTNHFEQCLKLHVALTRIEFNCGLLEECNHTANIVLHHAKSFEQKMDVYNQKLLCLLQQQRALEAVDLCLLILQGLGYKLPKRFIPLHVIRRYITVENFLKKTSDDDIRNFSNFSDQTVDDQLNILYRLGEMVYFGAPPIYLDLLSVDVIYMMKQKGNHPLVTPMGLMVWAVVQIVKGNFEESRRFSSLSMEMAERLCKNHPTMKLRIKNLCRFFQGAWNGPLQELVQPMLADNRAVLELGGMEDYHLEGVNASRFVFFCGRPLGEVQAECSSYMGVL
ncbi:PAS sensor protein [Nitzschia inconspicua]|uniref:PAS sensor protein n=1 Tax=Nitzschia inconspicua TaxID=303405 RepID=A0A9K3PE22_9STRA|nr:PAS sensor protein [Nitzschia inconspicua]